MRGMDVFISHVEHLKLRCKEVWQEIIMGYKTSVSWCWANDKYKFYVKDLSFEHKNRKAKKELIE